MAIDSDDLAQMTARAGVGRAGTMRANVCPPASEMKDNGTGEILWDRPVTQDYGPPNAVLTSWTRGKE